MTSKSINYLQIFSLFCFLLTIDAMDPEIQLCEDLSIDAAVVADDNVGYAFKGQFYWQMSTTSGISPNFIARNISNRWKGLSGPIDAAFTIDDSKYKLCTVFIKGNQWFLYQMENLKAKGNTTNWPNIIKSPVLSSFEVYNDTLERKDFAVYLLYSANQFSKYYFHDIERPTHVTNGKAYRKGKFLYFIYDPKDDKPGTLLSEILEPQAVISDDKGLVFYGPGGYCITKQDILPLCIKTTDIEVVRRYYGCPRNPFPTTTSTSITTPELPPKTDISKYEELTQAFTDVRPITPGEEVSQINDYPFETMGPINDKTSGDYGFGEVIPPFSSARVEESTDKSNAGLIILIVVIIVIICVIILFVILFFARNSNKKSSDKENAGPNGDNTYQDPLLAYQNREDTNQSVPTNETNPGLQTDSTISAAPSVRSVLGSESDEALGKPLKDDKLSEKPSNENKSNGTEADQMIDAIKTEDDI